MPKLDLTIELDNPKDYFKILEGDRFKGSDVKIKADGKRLMVSVSAESPKALISTIGNIIKQIRIIEQTTDLIE